MGLISVINLGGGASASVGGSGIISINGSSVAAQFVGGQSGIVVNTSGPTTIIGFNVPIPSSGLTAAITSLNGSTLAAQSIAGISGIVVNTSGSTTTLSASIPTSGANVTLSNLGATTAINTSLLFANGVTSTVGFPSDATNTAPGSLIISGASKTGFDQNGGDVFIGAGAATGAVASLPGQINMQVGGGGYTLATAVVRWSQLTGTGPGKRGTIISPGSIEIFGGGSGLAQNADEVAMIVNTAISFVYTPTEIETQANVDFTNVDGSGSLGVTINRHNRMQPFNYMASTQIAMCYAFGDAIPTSKAGQIIVKTGTNLSINADNFVLNGTGAALATTATKGFAYLATCAGTPTGVPASLPTGAAPVVIDTTAGKLWAYVGGAWKGALLI